MYGRYALPVRSPVRGECDVCGGPAQLARIDGTSTLGAWCGAECARGRRAGDLRVGEYVAVWASRFPEVSGWAGGNRLSGGPDLWPLPGCVRVAYVTAIDDAAVVLDNPGAGVSERLTIPADYPCTRFTGIMVRRRRRRKPGGRLVWRWRVDAPWEGDVTFGHWVSYQVQGLCEDADDCSDPATLWVSYADEVAGPTDGPSCEGCLARRLRRGARRDVDGADASARPSPVAFWNVALDAWDVRPNDGSGALWA